MIDGHAVKDLAFDVVVGCSVLHSVLPPWDAEPIAQFPSMQKWYKLFIFLTGYVALNARSTVYKSISTASGSKLSDANTRSQNGAPAAKPPEQP